MQYHFLLLSVAGLMLRTNVCFSKVFDNVSGVILMKQRLVVLIVALKDKCKAG